MNFNIFSLQFGRSYRLPVISDENITFIYWPLHEPCYKNLLQFWIQMFMLIKPSIRNRTIEFFSLLCLREINFVENAWLIHIPNSLLKWKQMRKRFFFPLLNILCIVAYKSHDTFTMKRIGVAIWLVNFIKNNFNECVAAVNLTNYFVSSDCVKKKVMENKSYVAVMVIV